MITLRLDPNLEHAITNTATNLVLTKSDLIRKVSLNIHQITERVTGHLFTCDLQVISVLAYHLVHSIRYQLKKHNITSSWSDLRKQLAGQNRVTVSMQLI